MKASSQLVSLLLVCVAIVALPIVSNAEEPTPRWVTKGVNELNDSRSNITYEFVALDMHDSDLNRLTTNNAVVLGEYAQNTLGARQASIKVSEEPTDTTLYHVSYVTLAGEPQWVIAKLVDKAFIYDDYEEGYYEYQYHQLFAISKPNTYPEYDDFTITRKYKSHAAKLSLIPGLGQIYKGQQLKGYAIMGGEAALVIGSIYFDAERAKCHRNSLNHEAGYDSWEKKSKSWGAMRDVGIGCAVALYIYNLLDAAYSNGIPQVVVNKRTDSKLSLVPFLDIDGAGLGIALNF